MHPSVGSMTCTLVVYVIGGDVSCHRCSPFTLSNFNCDGRRDAFRTSRLSRIDDCALCAGNDPAHKRQSLPTTGLTTMHKRAKTTKLNDDGMGIPDFLKRNGDDKPTPAAPAAPAVSVPQSKVKPHHVPKGMTEEEYNEKKNELDPPKPVLEPKAKKEKKAPRAVAPHGTFKLADWARDNKLAPTTVRRVARGHKKELASLYANGLKYVFMNEDEPKVAKIIRDGLASESKKKVVVKAPAKKEKEVQQLPRDHTNQAAQDARLAAAKLKASQPKKSKFGLNKAH